MALSSNARLDDVISSTTAPGDALHLFADDASPGFAAPAPAMVEPVAAVDAEPKPEPAYRRRERLRDERAALVSDLARSKSHEHRAVNAWINREVGARSVGDATAKQLERAIVRLTRELRS